MTRVSGTQGYGEHAMALAERYESISFADVHAEVAHLIPPAPARIADIGAGSGRTPRRWRAWATGDRG